MDPKILQPCGSLLEVAAHGQEGAGEDEGVALAQAADFKLGQIGV